MQRLAQVVSQFQPQLPTLSPQQYKVCHQIQRCRTAALGGFQLHCHDCGQAQRLYHACRNRHCPRCQQGASEQWLERELSNVVNAPYFHLVFTLPHDLNGWVRLHPRVIYSALFASVWETLNTLGHDSKRLNGQLAATAVLHTWGQNLSQHVHLHCLIPGGALGDDGHWHAAKNNYLFPVRALSHLFRGKMVSALRAASYKGELSRITNAGEVNKRLRELMQKEWVVYGKPCLHKAETVVRYLSRYTRKIAISESRLIAIDEHNVTFRYQDYRDAHSKVMRLTGAEFLRRFLQHVLPHGFMRIRHYGWLANACRKRKLQAVRQAIANAQNAPLRPSKPSKIAHPHAFEGIPCRCGQGMLRVSYRLVPWQLEYG
ncbi:IS91 family transposase [Leucothrix arctica]|uniref:IS91 family transposase n=1 Tax=Leucothrix arctica TaxID=1481894 RepID=A0A317CJW8_9GAMM|nr:IS91 family transposase [Leucothrix arctica]PWQ98015.1 IS91 family transposase [Leucothrix arctica]PWQ98885.1 IS91 family transposase [Leucothrix arctica]PWQ99656.1 IS91 family transposase [Leucothrix arctica]